MEPVFEPIVERLDHALAVIGLGPTDESLTLLRSFVALLDGPLVQLFVDGLLGVGDLEAHSTVVDSPPIVAVAAVDAAVSVPATSASITAPAVAAPSVAAPAVTLPTNQAPLLSLPAVSVPSIDVPILDLPPITSPIVSTPPLTLPSLAS